MGEETRTFLLRVANRIHTSRELSQPKVIGHLLGFETDFTNVTEWTWIHLNSLYWACARQWPSLRAALTTLGQEPHSDNVCFQTSGFKLSYLEAYKHRGPILAHLCFYDYVSFVVLKKSIVIREVQPRCLSHRRQQSVKNGSNASELPTRRQYPFSMVISQTSSTNRMKHL
jgi:hypothetical protein